MLDYLHYHAVKDSRNLTWMQLKIKERIYLLKVLIYPFALIPILGDKTCVNSLTISFLYFPGIIKVVKCCTKLQTLYLRRCVNITDKAIEALAHNCLYIQHLNIAACNITDESLKALANNSKYLQSLNVCKTKVSFGDHESMNMIVLGMSSDESNNNRWLS